MEKLYYYLDRHSEYKVGDQVTVPVGSMSTFSKRELLPGSYIVSSRKMHRFL